MVMPRSTSPIAAPMRKLRRAFATSGRGGGAGAGAGDTPGSSTLASDSGPGVGPVKPGAE